MRISWWWVALFFATILKHEVVFTDSIIPAQTERLNRIRYLVNGSGRMSSRSVNLRSNIMERDTPSDIGSWSQLFRGMSGTFGQSSREPKFNIEFHSEDSPFHPDDDQESIVMPNSSGEKFLCFLPKVEKSKSKLISQHNISSMVVESETRNKIKTPDELLEVLKKDICFARQEGWWSYEFCPHNKIRQLHIDGDKVLQEFIMGVFDSEATEAYNQNLADISTLKDPRSKDASQRYHVHLFTNGTVCDLTNEPRQTEVRFVCSEPKAMISSITELSTCKYALTFQCPTLCKHPLFHEERPVSHTIHCNILAKDYKKGESKSEAGIFPRGTIKMVMDGEFPRSINLEEHAT